MDFAQGWWAIPYLVGLGIISYLSSYSGSNRIPFGWDFVIIAVFTLLIFFLAQYLSGQPNTIANTRRKVNELMQ